MTTQERKEFAAGTPCTCNRCSKTSPLPRPIAGMQENSRAYRLEKMCTLECGHMDAHWIFTAKE